MPEGAPFSLHREGEKGEEKKFRKRSFGQVLFSGPLLLLLLLLTVNLLLLLLPCARLLFSVFSFHFSCFSALARPYIYLLSCCVLLFRSSLFAFSPFFSSLHRLFVLFFYFSFSLMQAPFCSFFCSLILLRQNAPSAAAPFRLCACVAPSPGCYAPLPAPSSLVQISPFSISSFSAAQGEGASNITVFRNGRSVTRGQQVGDFTARFLRTFRRRPINSPTGDARSFGRRFSAARLAQQKNAARSELLLCGTEWDGRGSRPFVVDPPEAKEQEVDG